MPWVAVRTRATTSRSHRTFSRKDCLDALSTATSCPSNATTGAATAFSPLSSSSAL